MADTDPLLPPFSPKPSSESTKRNSRTSVDDVIERWLGRVGAAQLFQAFFVSFAWVFDAQQTFINVFSDATPPWHCTTSNCSSSYSSSSSSSPCGLPAGEWEWDRPAHSSIMSEWALQCASSGVTGLPASAYFFGCLLGGLILATLADSTLGRRNMLFISCLGMALAGLLTAASPNVWIYALLRFLTGFSRATIGTSALVLSTELVGKSSRGEVGIIGFFCFTLGFLSLPGIAYIYRDSSWRFLYLWTSGPALVYAVLVFFLVHESPRWLLVKGRKEEAIQTLTDMTIATQSQVMTYTFSGFNIGVSEEPGAFSSLLLLLRKRWARRRLAAIMSAGFGIGMVYYGMPLALGALGCNLYLSSSLNAVAELPSSLITFFLVGRINRRVSVLGFTMASGVSSVLCVFLSGNMKMGVEVGSFFCACTAFNVVLIYGLELFPTCVRNSALSMVRQALVLGGVFAPQLVSGARVSGSGFVSFGVFGIVIGICGLFVVLLPETKGSSICDTFEEQEYRERYSGLL
ncbi:organic cation/carnitine transporter 3-like [Wolffia australiana]